MNNSVFGTAKTTLNSGLSLLTKTFQMAENVAAAGEIASKGLEDTASAWRETNRLDKLIQRKERLVELAKRAESLGISLEELNND